MSTPPSVLAAMSSTTAVTVTEIQSLVSTPSAGLTMLPKSNVTLLPSAAIVGAMNPVEIPELPKFGTVLAPMARRPAGNVSTSTALSVVPCGKPMVNV